MDSSLRATVDLPESESPAKYPWIHIGSFLLTCISTVLVGVFNSAADGESTRLFSEMLRHPSILLRGAPYCISVMSILFAHEMGHYLTCRAYGISATLPYFIPAPTLVGTMGAFIKIKSPIHNRRALLDVGIGQWVYQRAKARGLGTEMPFGEH